MRFSPNLGLDHSHCPKTLATVLTACIMVLSSQPAHAMDGMLTEEEAAWLQYQNGYIYNLDLTVREDEVGKYQIVKIGYYSPFRRYSWFRPGDIIEAVNGEEATLCVLSRLDKNQTPWIKYRRGATVSEKQIGLEITVFRFRPKDFVDGP